MKGSFITHAVALFVAGSMFTSCGVFEGKKKKDDGTAAPETSIAKSEARAGGAFATFTSTVPGATFLCKTDFDGVQGTWAPCPADGFSIPVKPNQVATLSVKSIVNGVEDPTPASQVFVGGVAPVAPPAPEAPAADPFANAEAFESPLRLVHFDFNIPQGMNMLRRSEDIGAEMGAEVFVRTDAVDTATNRMVCLDKPVLRKTTGQSGAAYCHVMVGARDLPQFVATTTMTASYASMETEKVGADQKYRAIIISEFQNATEMSNRYSPFMSMCGNEPMGTQRRDMVPNVPMVYGFDLGQNAHTMNFHWCRAKYRGRAVMVGAFLYSGRENGPYLNKIEVTFISSTMNNDGDAADLRREMQTQIMPNLIRNSRGQL